MKAPAEGVEGRGVWVHESGRMGGWVQDVGSGSGAVVVRGPPPSVGLATRPQVAAASVGPRPRTGEAARSGVRLKNRLEKSRCPALVGARHNRLHAPRHRSLREHAGLLRAT